VLAQDGSIDKAFCVILAGQFGLAMLNAFGAGADRMVLMDATGGTNKYGYQLYVLLVVDDFREGVPVAYMVTSSQEATEITTMLEVSDLQVCCDMSRLCCTSSVICVRVFAWPYILEIMEHTIHICMIYHIM
jgi:MULE transposase domain